MHSKTFNVQAFRFGVKLSQVFLEGRTLGHGLLTHRAHVDDMILHVEISHVASHVAFIDPATRDTQVRSALHFLNLVHNEVFHSDCNKKAKNKRSLITATSNTFPHLILSQRRKEQSKFLNK